MRNNNLYFYAVRERYAIMRWDSLIAVTRHIWMLTVFPKPLSLTTTPELCTLGHFTLTDTPQFKSLGTLRNVLDFHENIHEMSCKINRKYNQYVDKVINNNCVLQTLLSSKNPQFSAITALQTFWHSSCQFCWGNLKRFHPVLPEPPHTSWTGLMGISYVPHSQAAPTTIGLRCGDCAGHSIIDRTPAACFFFK